PLDDEQIPTALDFILEVLEYIITESEKKDYTEWSDVRTKVEKVKSKVYRRYQKSAKNGHTCETNDPYDSSWYCRKGGKLERIVSKRKSEKFDQEIEGKKITQEKEKAINISTILEYKDVVMDPIKNFQKEILAVLNDWIIELNDKEEKVDNETNSKSNAEMNKKKKIGNEPGKSRDGSSRVIEIEPKDKKGLGEDKRPTCYQKVLSIGGTYKSWINLELAQRTFKKLEEKETINKVNIPEVYQKNKVMPKRSLYEISDVEKRKQSTSNEMLDDKAQNKNDHKLLKEGSVEKWRSSEYEKPLNGDALGHACDLWIKKVTKFRGMVKKNENNNPKKVSRYLDNCGPYEVELEENCEKEAPENYQKAPGIEIINEIIIVKIKCEKKMEVENKLQKLEALMEPIWLDLAIEKKINMKEKNQNSDDVNHVYETIELGCKNKVKTEIGSMEHTDKSTEQSDFAKKCKAGNYDEISRKENEVDEIEVVEGADSTGQFNLAGLIWWRKLQLEKIKKEALAENNDNKDEGRNNGTEESLKEEAISRAYEKWNRRYKKIDKLPKSDKENEGVTSESNCMDVFESVDNELVDQLFDPGGVFSRK
ncbi:22248_t:CDS:10, partial [Gigaspora margarita]